ncbi:MAG: 16S rRNA (cytosine(967)-C(5))-methyltransferase RsmB, partial [Clostridia bacterium]|nr:16S rRNA (cytosine(967)-C(5))-methyltransferase RsmB [Clostridia bacterium]
LTVVQYKILNNAASYTKSGGYLMYSTCTLRKAENEEQIGRFLSENPSFSYIYEHTFLPHIDGTDGFYCAVLKKE